MSEDNPVDADIERVRQGDLNAYTEVVRATQDRLRAYVLWACPDPDVAEDIAQDVYLYAWRNMDKYETGTNFLAWLKKVAHFRILNRAKSSAAQAQRERRYFDEFLFDIAAQTDLPLDAVDPLDSRMVILRKCLQKLPAKSLELIQQRYEKNLDAERLAKLLNKSAATIRVTLLRIREQLRRCVKTTTATEGVLS
ncbi:MAG: sigma-70 family RNA polymerase sigma factor [bacterium]